MFNMTKNHFIILMAIILIFAIGFFLRVESAHIMGTPLEEKSFYLDQNNLPYMYEADSYYNYRLTSNFLDHGYMGDVIIDGREWDLHSYYPPGVPLDYPPLIVYLTAFIYQLVNLFEDVPLMVVCFWLPAVIAPLSGVVAYLFTRRLTNEYGALVAGILTVLAPFYFLRTIPGWFDTDMFIIIFPLLVVWLYWEATRAKDYKNSLIISALLGFFMFLFSMAWNGWQYYFYLILIFSFLWVLWCYVKGKPTKHFCHVFLTFLGVTLLLLTIFSGYLNLLKLFYGPLELVKLTGTESLWAPWPDVYLSVNELAPPTIVGIISGLGFALFGGIFGLIWALRILSNNKLKETYLNSMDSFIYIFLVVWILTGFLALLEGSRFIMILIPPLTISTGIMAGLCVAYLNLLKENSSQNRFLSIFRTKKYLIQVLAIIIILIIVIPSFANVFKSMDIPQSVDDNLWDALEWINYNTSNDTVVFSNWPSGHVITAVANRSVALDGRMGYIETIQSRSFDKAYPYGVNSPSTAREYWIDHAFCTSNETLSGGIFRMLATSGDMAYLTLDQYTGNTTLTVEILNNILGVDNETARGIMVNNYNLTQEQALKIISYTHPENPTPYVIWTYTQMLDKGFWIFYFGDWDLNNNTGNNHTYTFTKFSRDGNIITTPSGLKADLNSGNVTYKGQVPYSVIVSGEDTLNKTYLNESSDFSVLILTDESEVVIIDKRFENSLFTKLVLEARNTTYFRSIYKDNSTAVWRFETDETSI